MPHLPFEAQRLIIHYALALGLSTKSPFLPGKAEQERRDRRVVEAREKGRDAMRFMLVCKAWKVSLTRAILMS